MTTETHTFQAETARLLNLVATALYSEREVFLRELISNASDACDKRRFLAQQQAELLDSDESLKILIAANKESATLAITDGRRRHGPRRFNGQPRHDRQVWHG